jgi:hypothetical protein
MSNAPLAGYTYGTAEVSRSPVSLDELRLLEASAGWSAADAEALRRAGDVLEDQVDAVLDTWLAPVRATPFLAAYYGTPDGRKIDERDPRHLQPAARPGVARLPARDRPAAPPRQEERDRRRGDDAAHPAALHDLGDRAHEPDDEALPRRQGPCGRGGRGDVRGLVQGGGAAGRAVELAVRERGGLLGSPGARAGAAYDDVTLRRQAAPTCTPSRRIPCPTSAEAVAWRARVA